MEKKLAKRLTRRRKYKHYAAALAGAAIMAGTSMHGLHFTKASAAENPTASPTVTTGQTTLIDKDAKKLIDETDVSATDTSGNRDSENNTVVTPDQRDKDKADQHADRDRRDQRHHRDGYDHSRYEHERWADRGETLAQRIKWYNDSLNKIQIYYNNTNAVEIVMAVADDLGFDVINDAFTLISQSGSESIINVVHNGNNYNVTVEQLANGNWIVSFVNPIQ
ncbi:hypothetical protein Ga0466249_005259 [Sporomusaceae bacterium BoRhaA]|jgi:hypothetical protein|uniref:hypothetical protein n=1 Tax=Pelorhabdus rhamnosifermentans TaxID=2772457 RepID=UPI001C05FFC4|nr:hypothetical protein [Pelorhabdus rhamnosifermentans]MBU2704106.1 hypothetical protein [Pelorhabdus rhamnosifermentans]